MDDFRERDERIDESNDSQRGMNRRQLLKWGAAAGAGLILSGKVDGVRKAMAEPLCAPYPDPTLPPPTWYFLDPTNPVFNAATDPLPIPPVLRPYQRTANADFYQLSVNETVHQLHSALPPGTRLLTYGGVYPGPTIIATRNRKVFLTVSNDTTGDYGGCPDANIMGATVGSGIPVPAAPLSSPHVITHLHGAAVAPESDGYPFDRLGPGRSFTHEYPNIQQSTLLWYHDHAMGLTRVNVLSGLAAAYILRDMNEANLNLPDHRFEVPLIIQDRSFSLQRDGSLWLANPWMPEFFGDYPVVNGRIWPTLRVTAGKYRFRILNGCNARVLNLSLVSNGVVSDHFTQIGTDGGLLPAPVVVTPKTYTFNDGFFASPGPPSSITMQLLMAPAERADVIVDFSNHNVGDVITLYNDAPAPFPGGGSPTPPMSQIMQFKVVAGITSDTPPLRRSLSWVRAMTPTTTTTWRYMTLVDYGAQMPTPAPPTASPYPTLQINDMRFLDPITETPTVGSTEVWAFINLAPDAHPIHVHQVQFQILGRARFDLAAYGTDLAAAAAGSGTPTPNASNQAQVPVETYFIDSLGNPAPQPSPPPLSALTPPDANEAGWKDTVRANPGEVTYIIAKFGPFRGTYVYHCHILDHEDNEMMRPFRVC